jgi:multidrug efflux pump subunit AcrB
MHRIPKRYDSLLFILLMSLTLSLANSLLLPLLFGGAQGSLFNWLLRPWSISFAISVVVSLIVVPRIRHLLVALEQTN